MTRRDFIGGAAALAAVPAFVKALSVLPHSFAGIGQLAEALA